MQATETFQTGLEQATVAIEIDLSNVWLISGNFSGTIEQGQIGFINGDVNQTGDVFIEGLLTGIDTFQWEGNGFTVFFQNGGRAILRGVVKGRWGEWGTGPKAPDLTGWQIGDRVAVTPTKVGKTLVLTDLTWTGDWATMTRPADAPDVTIVGNTVQTPEVANLSQSIVVKNLARGFHFHDSAGVQTLSDVRFLNCGTTQVLADYPVHFHQLYDNSRGSVLERVVVEGGKNHAYVPHGSHGISFTDCVAYKTTDSAFWWDPPGSPGDMTDLNNSDDIVWNHCLALGVNPSDNSDVRFTGFAIGEGSGNVCTNCVAVGVGGGVNGQGKNASGFRWQQNSVWVFNNNKAHNNRRNGIFNWTQSPEDHLVEDFVAYHNRRSGIEHGSYINSFTFRNCVLHTGNKMATGSDATAGVMQHALSRGDGLLFEDIITDDRLSVEQHGFPTAQPVIHRRCTYSNVVYIEGSVKESSVVHFEDCGLVPSDFQFISVKPDSVIEIYEGGLLMDRAVGGVWE